MIPSEALRKRAEALHLHGLLAHWSELAECAWVEPSTAGNRGSYCAPPFTGAQRGGIRMTFHELPGSQSEIDAP